MSLAHLRIVLLVCLVAVVNGGGHCEVRDEDELIRDDPAKNDTSERQKREKKEGINRTEQRRDGGD